MSTDPAPGPAAAAPAPPTLTVQIATRTIVITVLLAVAVWLAFRLTHFLLVVTLAILLATAIDEPVGWLRRRGLPRPLGILALYVVLLALLGLVAVVLVPLVGAEITTLRGELPRYADQVEQAVHRLSPDAGAPLTLAQLTEELRGHLSTVADRLTAVTLTIGRTAVLVFATLVVAFFLAVEPTVGTRLLARVAPPAWYARTMPLAASARLRIGAWARGQVVIAIIFGLAMGFGLRLLGVPYAASLGTIAGVLELLPYVGGFITVILAGMMALTVGVPQLIGVVVLYLVLVGLEAHVLAPLLFGRAVGLPPIAILLALLAGVELLGIVGALLAVPATVIVWVVAAELWPARHPAAPQPDPAPGQATPE